MPWPGCAGQGLSGHRRGDDAAVEFTVDLDARMSGAVEEEALADFLDALEGLVAAPAVSYKTDTYTLGARFIVQAPHIQDAAVRALRAFSDALAAVGFSPAAFTALQVLEEREEAAAIA